MAETRLQCLVTGFNAFGSHDFNPSEWVVNELPDEIEARQKNEKIEFTKLTLSTCCTSSWGQIQGALKKQSFDMVMLLGMAQGRSHICLERFALNIRDFRIEDNNGHKWRDRPIENNGPAAVRTYRNLDNLEAHLSGKGMMTDVSNYAGAFICNEAFYRCLRYQEDHPALNTVLFIHLPSAEDYAKTLNQTVAGRKRLAFKGAPRSRRDSALHVMKGAVEEIARYCALNRE